MKWLRRIRGALLTGVTWAFAWAVGGLLIGVASKLTPWLPIWDVFFGVFDAPLPALAVPGFVGGLIFSVVLGIAGRERRFSDMSVSRFALWGALGGALLCLVPLVLFGLGLATPTSGANLLAGIGVVATPFILMSAASAAGSLKLARMAERREEIASGARAEELTG